MRYEDLADKGRGRTEAIMNVQKQIDETKAMIMQSKQHAAQQKQNRQQTPDN